MSNNELRIRVTETREYIYIPDFDDEDFYGDCDGSILEAMKKDKLWIEKHKGDLSDLDGDSSSHVVWDIIDVNGKVVIEAD
jgi:hypothetical protein